MVGLPSAALRRFARAWSSRFIWLTWLLCGARLRLRTRWHARESFAFFLKFCWMRCGC